MELNTAMDVLRWLAAVGIAGGFVGMVIWPALRDRQRRQKQEDEDYSRLGE